MDDGIFVGVRLEGIEPRRALLTFDTTIETTCEAQLGQQPTQLDRRFLDPFMDPDDPYGLEHAVPLVQLTPDTLYHVQARAEDRAGREYRSPRLSFRTPVAGPGSGPINLARLDEGTTVLSVSSNFGDAANAETWGIDNALDGDLRTEWSSYGDGDAASFELDLGDRRRIARIGFRSRKMLDGTSIIESFRLMADDDRAHGPFRSPDPDTYYEFNLDPPIATRTLRFEAVRTTGGNTGIKEFELYEP
jgi:hypothetical protein